MAGEKLSQPVEITAGIEKGETTAEVGCCCDEEELADGSKDRVWGCKSNEVEPVRERDKSWALICSFVDSKLVCRAESFGH